MLALPVESGKRVIFRSSMYVSRRALATLNSERAVGEIVAAARKRNATLGITGGLVCTRTHFAQLLEGPPAAVDALMHMIETDPRHAEVTILDVSLVAQRQVANWSMAYNGDSTYVARQIEALLLDPDNSAPLLVSRLRSLIVGFATTNPVQGA